MNISLGIKGLLAAALLSACMAPQGPRVRVATATKAELESVQSEDVVWYEFQPGDVVPVQFGFLGTMEGGSDGPAVFRAKRQFYFVTTQHGLKISFDGKSFAGPNSSQSVIAVVPRRDGKGGALVWAIYVGESGDAEGELDRILAESSPAQEE